MVKGLSNSVSNFSSANSSHATLYKSAFEKSKKDLKAFNSRKNKKGVKVSVKPVFIAINPEKQIIRQDRDEKKLMKQLKIKNKPSLSVKNDKVVNGYSFLRFKSPKEAKKFMNEYNQISYIDNPTLELVSTKTHQKFDYTIKNYDLNLKSALKNSGDINTALSDGIENEINKVKDGDKLRIIIGTDEGYISTSLMSKKDFIDKFFNNDTGFYNFDEVIVDTNFQNAISDGASVSIQTATGVSGGRGIECNDKSKVYNKRSILMIKNTDDLCLGRCIVCEIAQKDNHPKKQQIREGRKIQTELTHQLYEEAGIEKKLADLDMVRDFEKHLDCSITIIDGDQFNNVIYPDVNSDDYKPKDFNIYLYKNKNHYDLINSNKVAGFFGKTFFCQKCKKTHATQKHKC